ncbi:ATP-binding cassette domain-containing protein [Spirochaeta cellobiosiphila]|uniref:ATP-binding cassette domain-containing protein n=1 Tax=Spirochaeta cellobiosiphila TaxID=504483 RepID=UPI00056778C8|nr:ATP-binding cassette domain-containing protein [Spirochaeta cellobiosiphila]
MNDDETLFMAQNVSLLVKHKVFIKNINIKISKGDLIFIYGQNGSGKTLLADYFSSHYKGSFGDTILTKHSAVVSTAEENRFLEQERYNDASDYQDGLTDKGRTIGDILYECSHYPDEKIKDLIASYQLEPVLGHGLKFLSTGEFRKLMLVKSLLSKPELIILDEPVTGLDINSRTYIKDKLIDIKNHTEALVVITGRFDDIPVTEARYFLLTSSGLKEFDTLEDLKKDVGYSESDKSSLVEEKYSNNTQENISEEIIYMNNVNLKYYEDTILSNISWVVHKGEHWQISGPNGSGKSSLLSLLEADNPKAYGQEIRMFGKLKGSGETIWDIKKKIGYVSGALQRNHRVRQSVLKVIISGLYDSIGLYTQPTTFQTELAKKIANQFEISDLHNTSFHRLSEGKKRVVLIARAIIKTPELLIVDEPCQGLDDLNSSFILKVLNNIAMKNETTILYVSHDPLYQVRGIKKHLTLVPSDIGGYTAIVTR